MRIDDPWLAEAWRDQQFGGSNTRWAADVIGKYAVTAGRLLDSIIANETIQRVFICGTSQLTLALCANMTRRALGTRLLHRARYAPRCRRSPSSTTKPRSTCEITSLPSASRGHVATDRQSTRWRRRRRHRRCSASSAIVTRKPRRRSWSTATSRRPGPGSPPAFPICPSMPGIPRRTAPRTRWTSSACLLPYGLALDTARARSRTPGNARPG